MSAIRPHLEGDEGILERIRSEYDKGIITAHRRRCKEHVAISFLLIASVLACGCGRQVGLRSQAAPQHPEPTPPPADEARCRTTEYFISVAKKRGTSVWNSFKFMRNVGIDLV